MRKIILSLTFTLMVGIIIIGCNSDNRKTEEKILMTKKDINEVKKAHVDSLMAIHGVVGVYIGALNDGTRCIVVMASKKTSELENKIPKSLDGFPVRIDETGEIKPLK